MKATAVLALIICYLSLHSCCLIPTSQPQIPYPEVTFKYDWRSRLMDTAGSFYFGSIPNKLYGLLEEQLPLFEATWKQDAPILFGEVHSTFKRGFIDKTRTAILNLSHNWSYGSHWFLIFGLRWHLAPEDWNLSVSREDWFSAHVFHELLHIWVDENIDKSSSLLLKKYCDEDYHTLEHLHLMAIQKMVYLKINRLDILHTIDECYRNLAPASYRRAWQVVNDIEGHEVILKDIAASLKHQDSTQEL